jgi:hypothetical protein
LIGWIKVDGRCVRRLQLLLALALLAASGCSGADGGALERDELRRRMLRYQQDRLHQRSFYVGIADGPDLQAATRKAYDAISRQLTWLPGGSRHLLAGRYRVDRTGTDRDGRVHVLAVLEREDASRHLARLRDRRTEELRAALPGCEHKLADGNLEAARACVAGAQKLAADARTLHAASRAAVGDPAPSTVLPGEGRLERLAHRLGQAEDRLRSVLVRVLGLVDGKLTDLDSPFQQVVTGAGRKLSAGTLSAAEVRGAMNGSTSELATLGRERGAGLLVLGIVEARYSGAEMGQHFAFADGRLKLVETIGGGTLAELAARRIKGGHISRAQACQRAADNAVRALGGLLRGKLQKQDQK